MLHLYESHAISAEVSMHSQQQGSISWLLEASSAMKLGAASVKTSGYPSMCKITIYPLACMCDFLLPLLASVLFVSVRQYLILVSIASRRPAGTIFLPFYDFTPRCYRKSLQFHVHRVSRMRKYISLRSYGSSVLQLAARCWW